VPLRCAVSNLRIFDDLAEEGRTAAAPHGIVCIQLLQHTHVVFQSSFLDRLVVNALNLEGSYGSSAVYVHLIQARAGDSPQSSSRYEAVAGSTVASLGESVLSSARVPR
jgi:hypothetical protein